MNINRQAKCTELINKRFNICFAFNARFEVKQTAVYPNMMQAEGSKQPHKLIDDGFKC